MVGLPGFLAPSVLAAAERRHLPSALPARGGAGGGWERAGRGLGWALKPAALPAGGGAGGGWERAGRGLGWALKPAAVAWAGPSSLPPGGERARAHKGAALACALGTAAAAEPSSSNITAAAAPSCLPLPAAAAAAAARRRQPRRCHAAAAAASRLWPPPPTRVEHGILRSPLSAHASGPHARAPLALDQPHKT